VVENVDMELHDKNRPNNDYLIFYRILNDTVEILHVLHGARDYEPILFPNE
jgi:toxin ParE1/3/4